MIIPQYSLDFSGSLSAVGGLTPLPLIEQPTGRVKGLKPFDPVRVSLHLDEGQKRGDSMTGLDLRKLLAKVEVFGAPALDFYLSNLHLIPSIWKGRVIYFWTVYTDGKELWVRGLCYYGDCGWGECRRCLRLSWPNDVPVAVLGS